MKKLILGAIALAAVVFGILLFLENHNYFSHNPPSAPSPPRRSASLGPVASTSSNNLVIRSGPRWEKPKINRSTNEWEKFRAQILPIAQDFLKRIESSLSNKVILPVNLPLTLDQVTSQEIFVGPTTNTISRFVIGGHSLIGCLIVRLEGKETRRLHTFQRRGRDETGMPRNIIQLTDNPIANAEYIKLLADTNRYPPRDLKEVAAAAQRVMAAVHPEDADRYRLNESWQEQSGATVLPFYNFGFLRKGPPSTDPANLMRDEIMIGLKSTTEGLVLDSFEDNSLAFLGQREKTK